jgi:hypothetical protein
MATGEEAWKNHDELFHHLLPFICYPRSLNALAVLNEVTTT